MTFVGSPGLIRSRSMTSAAARRTRLPDSPYHDERPSNEPIVRFSRDRQLGEQAIATLLGRVAHARHRRRVRGRGGRRASADADLAGEIALQPVHDAPELGPSRAHESRDPDDLAGVDGQVDVAQATRRDLLDLEDGATDGTSAGRRCDGVARRARRVEARDERAHLVDGQLPDRSGEDLATVTQDGDVVGDVVDLLEPMADVDDRQPAVAQSTQLADESRGLVLGQARGGLVEDQDVASRVDVVERAGDREERPLDRAERRDVRARVGGDADGRQLLAGPAGLRSPADRPEPVVGIAAREAEVVGDREVRDEREVLVDEAQAGRSGPGWRAPRCPAGCRGSRPCPHRAGDSPRAP